MFILALLGVSIILLSGCYGLGSSKEKEPLKQYICEDGKTIVNDITNCPRVDTQLIECEKSSVKEDYNGDTERNACYFNLGVERYNLTLCKKIYSTSSYSTYTAAKCGAQIAIQKDDNKACDGLGALSSSECYYELAKQLKDPLVCTNIVNTQKKDECITNYISYNYYYVTDWSICDKISSSKASDCYYDAAKSTDQVKYCDKITTNSYYSSQSQCYGAIAKDLKNPNLCTSLPTTPSVDQCYYIYASSYPYDANICKKIVDQYKKDDCNYYTNKSYYY